MEEANKTMLEEDYKAQQSPDTQGGETKQGGTWWKKLLK
jgi:hypothetical protein